MTAIAGKVALVTGGGSGIGRALALALAAEGAAVVVADILPESGEAVAGEITAAGGTAVPVVCDVSDRAGVRRTRAEAEAALGPVGLLFANAGASSFDPLVDMTDDDLDWIVQVNLMAVLHCVRTFAPGMVARGDGHVVATASAAGLLPALIPTHSVYSAVKAGVIAMMLNLRHELGRAGVGASVLVPARTTSNMRAHNARYRPERFGGPGDGEITIPPDVVDVFSKVEMTYRPAEDVAAMVLTAVREDRPLIVTDPGLRQVFEATYADLVRRALDDVVAFDRGPAPR